MTIALRHPLTKILLGVISFFLLFSFAQITQAQTVCGPNQKADIDANGAVICADITGLTGGVYDNASSATDVVGRVLNIVLGFLGLIALILFIIGGFQWMTSGGNEEKTAGAKKLMVSAIIGLIIILSAAVISNFVINALKTSLGDSTAKPI